MPHAHPHIFPGSPAPTPNPFHPDPGEKGGGAQDGMYTNRQAEYNAGVTATVTTARLQRTLLLLSMYDPTNVGLASLSSADMASQLKLAFKSAKGALGRQQRVLTKPMRTTTQVGTLQGAVVLGRGGGADCSKLSSTAVRRKVSVISPMMKSVPSPSTCPPTVRVWSGDGNVPTASNSSCTLARPLRHTVLATCGPHQQLGEREGGAAPDLSKPSFAFCLPSSLCTRLEFSLTRPVINLIHFTTPHDHGGPLQP